MNTSLPTVALLTGIALTGCATGTPRPHAAPPRPRGTVGYWQQLAFQPRNLDAWWNGYTSRGDSTSLASCRTTGPVTQCRIVRMGLTLGFAALGRYAPCQYEYLLREAAGPNKLRRRFRHCP